MSKDTGGSAFGTRTVKQQAESTDIEGGLTIRDYFAAKAMQALLNEEVHPDYVDTYIGMLAERSYQISDAMLTERNK